MTISYKTVYAVNRNAVLNYASCYFGLQTNEKKGEKEKLENIAQVKATA